LARIIQTSQRDPCRLQARCRRPPATRRQEGLTRHVAAAGRRRLVRSCATRRPATSCRASPGPSLIVDSAAAHPGANRGAPQARREHVAAKLPIVMSISAAHPPPRRSSTWTAARETLIRACLIHVDPHRGSPGHPGGRRLAAWPASRAAPPAVGHGSPAAGPTVGFTDASPCGRWRDPAHFANRLWW
jgi:hypothetical protein